MNSNKFTRFVALTLCVSLLWTSGEAAPLAGVLYSGTHAHIVLPRVVRPVTDPAFFTEQALVQRLISPRRIKASISEGTLYRLAGLGAVLSVGAGWKLWAVLSSLASQTVTISGMAIQAASPGTRTISFFRDIRLESGDSPWSIAQKFLGHGAELKQITDLNPHAQWQLHQIIHVPATTVVSEPGAFLHSAHIAATTVYTHPVLHQFFTYLHNPAIWLFIAGAVLFALRRWMQSRRPASAPAADSVASWKIYLDQALNADLKTDEGRETAQQAQVALQGLVYNLRPKYQVIPKDPRLLSVRALVGVSHIANTLQSHLPQWLQNVTPFGWIARFAQNQTWRGGYIGESAKEFAAAGKALLKVNTYLSESTPSIGMQKRSYSEFKTALFSYFEIPSWKNFAVVATALVAMLVGTVQAGFSQVAPPAPQKKVTLEMIYDAVTHDQAENAATQDALDTAKQNAQNAQPIASVGAAGTFENGDVRGFATPVLSTRKAPLQRDPTRRLKKGSQKIDDKKLATKHAQETRDALKEAMEARADLEEAQERLAALELIKANAPAPELAARLADDQAKAEALRQAAITRLKLAAPELALPDDADIVVPTDESLDMTKVATVGADPNTNLDAVQSALSAAQSEQKIHSAFLVHFRSRIGKIMPTGLSPTIYPSWLSLGNIGTMILGSMERKAYSPFVWSEQADALQQSAQKLRDDKDASTTQVHGAMTKYLGAIDRFSKASASMVSALNAMKDAEPEMLAEIQSEYIDAANDQASAKRDRQEAATILTGWGYGPNDLLKAQMVSEADWAADIANHVNPFYVQALNAYFGPLMADLKSMLEKKTAKDPEHVKAFMTLVDNFLSDNPAELPAVLKAEDPSKPKAVGLGLQVPAPYAANISKLDTQGHTSNSPDAVTIENGEANNKFLGPTVSQPATFTAIFNNRKISQAQKDSLAAMDRLTAAGAQLAANAHAVRVESAAIDKVLHQEKIEKLEKARSVVLAQAQATPADAWRVSQLDRLIANEKAALGHAMHVSTRGSVKPSEISGALPKAFNAQASRLTAIARVETAQLADALSGAERKQIILGLSDQESHHYGFYVLNWNNGNYVIKKYVVDNVIKGMKKFLGFHSKSSGDPAPAIVEATEQAKTDLRNVKAEDSRTAALAKTHEALVGLAEGALNDTMAGWIKISQDPEATTDEKFQADQSLHQAEINYKEALRVFRNAQLAATAAHAAYEDWSQWFAVSNPADAQASLRTELKPAWDEKTLPTESPELTAAKRQLKNAQEGKISLSKLFGGSWETDIPMPYASWTLTRPIDGASFDVFPNVGFQSTWGLNIGDLRTAYSDRHDAREKAKTAVQDISNHDQQVAASNAIQARAYQGAADLLGKVDDVDKATRKASVSAPAVESAKNQLETTVAQAGLTLDKTQTTSAQEPVVLLETESPTSIADAMIKALTPAPGPVVDVPEPTKIVVWIYEHVLGANYNGTAFNNLLGDPALHGILVNSPLIAIPSPAQVKTQRVLKTAKTDRETFEKKRLKKLIRIKVEGLFRDQKAKKKLFNEATKQLQSAFAVWKGDPTNNTALQTLTEAINNFFERRKDLELAAQAIQGLPAPVLKLLTVTSLGGFSVDAIAPVAPAVAAPHVTALGDLADKIMGPGAREDARVMKRLAVWVRTEQIDESDFRILTDLVADVGFSPKPINQRTAKLNAFIENVDWAVLIHQNASVYYKRPLLSSTEALKAILKNSVEYDYIATTAEEIHGFGERLSQSGWGIDYTQWRIHMWEEARKHNLFPTILPYIDLINAPVDREVIGPLVTYPGPTLSLEALDLVAREYHDWLTLSVNYARVEIGPSIDDNDEHKRAFFEGARVILDLAYSTVAAGSISPTEKLSLLQTILDGAENLLRNGDSEMNESARVHRARVIVDDLGGRSPENRLQHLSGTAALALTPEGRQKALLEETKVLTNKVVATRRTPRPLKGKRRKQAALSTAA